MLLTTETAWGNNVTKAVRPMETLTPHTAGLTASTKVATEIGWRPVTALCEGDRVLTFDNGLQPLREVIRHRVCTADARRDPLAWPLAVPADALGNLSQLVVMPGQSVLVESDLAESLMGDPFALIEALHLEGVNGIARAVPPYDLEIVTLHFDDDQIVFGAGGALFLCEGPGSLTDEPGVAPYRVLSEQEAAFVVQAGLMPGGTAHHQAA